jgi:hypothetical protein
VRPYRAFGREGHLCGLFRDNISGSIGANRGSLQFGRVRSWRAAMRGGDSPSYMLAPERSPPYALVRLGAPAKEGWG